MDVDSLVEENKASKERIQEGEKIRVSLEDQIKALKKELYDLKNAPQGPRQSESTPSMSNALDSTTDSTTSNSGTISINLDTALTTDSVPATTTTISTTSASNGITTVNKNSTTTTTTSGRFNAVSPVTSTTPIDYSKKDEQKGVAEKVRVASLIDKTTTVPVNNGSIATAKLHKRQPPFLDLPNAAATNATLAKIGLQEIEKVLQNTSAATSVGVTAPSHAPSGNNKGDTTVGDCTSTTTKHSTSTSPVATATTTGHTNRSLSTSAKTLHSSTNILNDEEQGGERDDFSPPPFVHSPISFSVNSPNFLTSNSSRNEIQQDEKNGRNATTLTDSSRNGMQQNKKNGNDATTVADSSSGCFNAVSPVTSATTTDFSQKDEQKGVAEKVNKTTDSNVPKAVPRRPRIIILPATDATVRPTNSRFTTMTSLINKTTTVLVNNGSVATKNEMQQDEKNGTDATTSDDIVDQKPSLPSLHALSYSTSKGIDNTVTATISPPSTEDSKMSTDTFSVADIPDLFSKRNAVLKELEKLDTVIQSLKEGNSSNCPANTKPVRPSKRKRKVSTLGTLNGQGSQKSPHTGDKPHECSTCGKTFALKSSLNRHMKTHSGEKPHDCPTCGKAFLYKSKLTKHIEGHKGETQCECYVCGKQYLLNEDLKIHMKSHSGERPHECTVCAKTFTVKSALNTHMRTHTGVKPYKCAVCGKMYEKPSWLEVHIRSHTGEKPYQCAFCGKGFAAKAKHTQHVKLHGEKIEICSICGKAFPRTDYLKIHMRTHTGERPYECSTCGKAFRAKSALNTHIKIHTGETPHACSVCGKAFAQSGTLQQHLRVHTGAKPYLCSTCGKAFACGSAYRVHKRIHTGSKPYKCPTCGKAFSSSSNLYLHKRTHSGERPFVCTACGKAFMFKAHLKRHAKIHAKVRGNEFTSWSYTE